MDLPEHSDNLGKCPNSSQFRALRKFTRTGLWDYRAQLKTSQDFPIKFTPISAPKRDATRPQNEVDAKSSDKEALIL